MEAGEQYYASPLRNGDAGSRIRVEEKLLHGRGVRREQAYELAEVGVYPVKTACKGRLGRSRYDAAAHEALLRPGGVHDAEAHSCDTGVYSQNPQIALPAFRAYSNISRPSNQAAEDASELVPALDPRVAAARRSLRLRLVGTPERTVEPDGIYPEARGALYIAAHVVAYEPAALRAHLRPPERAAEYPLRGLAVHAFARREHELEAVPRQRLVYPAPQGVAGIREVAYDGRAYALLAAELEKALYALHRINWLRGAPAKVLELLIGHVELKPQALVDGQVQLEAVRIAHFPPLFHAVTGRGKLARSAHAVEVGIVGKMLPEIHRFEVSRIVDIDDIADAAVVQNEQTAGAVISDHIYFPFH